MRAQAQIDEIVATLTTRPWARTTVPRRLRRRLERHWASNDWPAGGRGSSWHLETEVVSPCCAEAYLIDVEAPDVP